eukprot:9291732-Pyramimonas_sp.AAC.1
MLPLLACEILSERPRTSYAEAKTIPAPPRTASAASRSSPPPPPPYGLDLARVNDDPIDKISPRGIAFNF